MKDEKKIIKDFSKWVDDQLPLDKWIGGMVGAIAERADGMLINFAINRGYNALPEDYKDEALGLMEAISSSNIDNIADEAIDALIVNIKTPLGDSKERILVGGIWGIIRDLINDRA